MQEGFDICGGVPALCDRRRTEEHAAARRAEECGCGRRYASPRGTRTHGYELAVDAL